MKTKNELAEENFQLRNQLERTLALVYEQEPLLKENGELKAALTASQNEYKAILGQALQLAKDRDRALASIHHLSQGIGLLSEAPTRATSHA